MKLRIALEEKLMDARVRDRLLAEGKITKEDVEKYLNSLPDDTANSVALGEEDNKNIQ